MAAAAAPPSFTISRRSSAELHNQPPQLCRASQSAATALPSFTISFGFAAHRNPLAAHPASRVASREEATSRGVGLPERFTRLSDMQSGQVCILT